MFLTLMPLVLVSMGLLLLQVLKLADAEAENVSLHQIVPICLASVPVDRHQATALLVAVATLAWMHWVRLTCDTSPQASVTLQIDLISCNVINR
jgi:hypothetical protein